MPRPAACCLCAALAGCAPDLRLSKPSRLCVDLPASHVADPDWVDTVVAGVDKALGDVGYRWSTRSMEKEDKWSHRWYLSEPRRGSGEPWNHVVVGYWTTPETYGQTCDMRVDVYSDRWRAHGEFEWRTFFLLRDRALPALMPDAAVSVLDHPGLRTWTWEASDLAARFAPREAIPLEVGLRIEAYERRWAAGRWWERAGAATWMAWKRTGAPTRTERGCTSPIP